MIKPILYESFEEKEEIEKRISENLSDDEIQTIKDLELPF